MAAGFIDGAYGMVHGLLQLTPHALPIAQLAACWFNPVLMIWGQSDCAVARSATITSLVFIKDMIDSDSEANKKVSAFRNSLGTSLNLWADQTFCFGSTQAQARCCEYHQGKPLFYIATFFYGPGEIKAGLEGFKLSTIVGQKLTSQLLKNRM